MAGDWIKMRTDLAKDLTVGRLKKALGLPDTHAVIGRLHCFWSWWDSNSRNGRVNGAVTVDCDDIVSTENFGASMVAVGWLGEDDQGLFMPNFDRHNGRAAKERALGKQRQEAFRARNGGSNANKTATSRPSNARGVTREEKSSSSNNHPPVAKNTAPPAQPPPTSTPVENSRSTPPPRTRSEAKTRQLLEEQAQAAASATPPPSHVVEAAAKLRPPPKPQRMPRANGEQRENLAEPEWWETPAGIQREGMSRGLAPDEHGEWHDFVARVFVAAGEGPWMDHAAPKVLERVEHWRTVGVSASG